MRKRALSFEWLPVVEVVAARAETPVFIKMMWSVVSYLSSSELVASFQRACGLFPAPRATHERLWPRSTKIHGRANGTSTPCPDVEHAANRHTSDVSIDYKKSLIKIIIIKDG